MICSTKLEGIVRENVANQVQGADAFKFDPDAKECIFGFVGGNRPFFDSAPTGGTGPAYWIFKDPCFNYESE